MSSVGRWLVTVYAMRRQRATSTRVNITLLVRSANNIFAPSRPTTSSDSFSRTAEYLITYRAVEMTMGMGFPTGMGIPWDSHGNGNWWQNWEWESEGMGNNLYGNGNDHYSHGNQFPSADTVLSLCNNTACFFCIAICRLESSASDDNFDWKQYLWLSTQIKDQNI